MTHNTYLVYGRKEPTFIWLHRVLPAVMSASQPGAVVAQLTRKQKAISRVNSSHPGAKCSCRRNRWCSDWGSSSVLRDNGRGNISPWLGLSSPGPLTTAQEVSISTSDQECPTELTSLQGLLPDLWQRGFLDFAYDSPFPIHIWRTVQLLGRDIRSHYNGIPLLRSPWGPGASYLFFRGKFLWR